MAAAHACTNQTGEGSVRRDSFRHARFNPGQKRQQAAFALVAGLSLLMGGMPGVAVAAPAGKVTAPAADKGKTVPATRAVPGKSREAESFKRYNPAVSASLPPAGS